MTMTSEQAREAGKKRAQMSLKDCICSRCGQVLPRKQRIKMGQPSELDSIGKLGGEKTFTRHGRDHYVAMGKLGGRGNTRAKRLAKEKGEVLCLK